MVRLGSRTGIHLLQTLIFLSLTAGFIIVIRNRLHSVEWSVQSFIWFWPGLLIAMLFIPVNWCLEAVKFQRLLGGLGWPVQRQIVRSMLPVVTLVRILLAHDLVPLLLAFRSHIGVYVKRIKEHFRNILGNGAVTSAWAWALLRYVTYCSQFALLLYFVGLVSPIGDAYVFIISFFFLQTILSLPPALGWLARIQVAVIQGGVFTIYPILAIAGSLILWLLNLVLPSLPGGFFLLDQNLYKHLKDVRTAHLPG